MSEGDATGEGRVTGVAGRTVLLAGGTSEAGRVAAQVLTAAGAHVIIAARDQVALGTLREALPGIRTERCDLTDETAVHGLGERVEALDGVLHLVGGWRGGGGLTGQTEGDFRALETSLAALRHVSRAFDPTLRASDAARTAIVSSTAVTRPLAGGANYAAVKAAAEAWNRAVAHGFAKHARDAGEPLRAAAVTYRVKTLAGREFALADAFARLWDDDAAAVNDTVVTLG